MSLGQIIASVATLVFLLLFGIPLLLFSGALDDEIKTEDNLKFDFLRLFSPRYLLKHFFSVVREFFFWGALLCVVLLLAFIVVRSQSLTDRSEQFLRPEYYPKSIAAYWIDGAIFGAIVGFGLAFLVGMPVLIFNVMNGLKSTSKFAAIKKPRQRIYAGFLKNVVFTLATLLVLLLLGLLINLTPVKPLGRILIALSLIVLFFFLLSLFRHGLFRHTLVYLCMALEKAIPFRIVAFLDYAVEMRILEKDGGYWRFRHQKLQEYFANLG